MLAVPVFALTWRSFCSRFLRSFHGVARNSALPHTDPKHFSNKSLKQKEKNGEKLMFKVGLVGLGYWGPNLARVLANNERCDFSACCDLDPRKLSKITRQYPSL